MDLQSLTKANNLALSQPQSPNRDLMEAISQFPYRGFIEVQITGAAPFLMFSNYDDIVASTICFAAPTASSRSA